MQVRAQVPFSGQASCSGSCLQRLSPKTATLAASRPPLHYARPQRLSQRVCAEGEKGEGIDGLAIKLMMAWLIAAASA